MRKILVIIGARPQFIKHFPFENAAKDRLDVVTVHTGQHYDNNMSAVFFEQLGMTRPDYMLNIGSDTHGAQTAAMIIEIERICEQESPDGLMVYGDTNSTLAGAIVASKMHIPVFHVEAGLRSYNKKMPEEINRIMTDHVSDLLLVPSERSIVNLEKEGIVSGVYTVGDIMKDLVQYVARNGLSKDPEIQKDYYYVTLHRPYNVDSIDRLTEILITLNKLDHLVVFAIHPRTKNKMKTNRLSEESYSNIKFIDPQGYLENVGFLKRSKALITDSGGMQKEAYWLKVPCVTVRSETEWVETLVDDANTLIFDDLTEMQSTLFEKKREWNSELYGDGQAAEIIVNHIVNFYRDHE